VYTIEFQFKTFKSIMLLVDEVHPYMVDAPENVPPPDAVDDSD
jgi:hypothetical protein